MKVNTFIIGVQKAGTTSLYEWLIQHPEVCGEIFLKDYPFFIDSQLYQQGNHVLEDRFNCGQEPVRISGCVDYIQEPEALKRIAAYNPKAKVILILRKPEKRIASAYTFLKQLAKEQHQDINKALKNDPEYLDRSLYGSLVEQLFGIFNPKQVKIVLFERLVSQSQEVLEEVYEFLNIKQGVTVALFAANQTAEPRFKALNKILFNKEKNIWFRTLVKKVFPPALRLKIVRFIKDSNTKNTGAPKPEHVIEKEYLAVLEKDRELLNNYIDVKAYW